MEGLPQTPSLFKQLKREIYSAGMTAKSRAARAWFQSKIDELNGKPVLVSRTPPNEEASKVAKVWLDRRVRNYREITASPLNRHSILNDTALKKRAAPRIGEMHMFVYDPKLKDELPYYDMFPLVIMVGPAEGGFYGLNLHYLHPLVRAAFLDKLTDTMLVNKGSESARLRITYEMLKKAARFAPFGPCFKHYLFDHVRTKFSKVGVEEWPIAIYLPTEHFAKANKQKVWRDSAKSYLGR